jgi:hypothetical protein
LRRCASSRSTAIPAAAAAASASSAALRSKCHRWTRGSPRSPQCASATSGGRAAPKSAACGSKAVLSRAIVAAPAKTSTLGEAPAKAGVLIAPADGAIDKKCVCSGRLAQRTLVGWRRGCGFALLARFFSRSLRAILIIQDHLLEAASSRALTLCPWNLTTGARRSTTLRCRAAPLATLASPGPASAGEPSAARELPAALPAASLPPLSLTLPLCVVVARRRAACRRIGGGFCDRPSSSRCSWVGDLWRGRGRFDAL